MRRPARLVLPIMLAALLLLGVAPAQWAHAAYPGPAGQVAYQVNDFTVRVLNANGQSTVGDPTGSGQEVAEPSFSPGGDMLAFELRGNRSEIWTLDLTNGQFFQLTTQPQTPVVASSSWTPDGSQIVFVGVDNADGFIKWWSVPPRGGAAPTPIATPTDVPAEPQVSPRGDVIAYWDERDDRLRLFIPATGQSATIFATGDQGVIGGQRDQDVNADGTPYLNVLQPNWAPDGSSVLFNCNTGGDGPSAQNRICEVRTDGTGLRVVSLGTESASGSAYSPDGTEIYYSDFDLRGGAIIPPRIYKVPTNDPRRENRVQVSPDDDLSTTHTVPDVGVPIGTAPGDAGSAGPTPLPGGASAGGGGGASTQPATAGAVFAADPAVTTVVTSGDPGPAAVQVSQLRFSDRGARHAALSRDDAFADSLAGTALTGEGPLLLTPTGALDQQVAGELQRVLPPGATVYLLGGTAALSATVEQAVRDLGFSPVRLAGPTRIATALATADEVVRLYGNDQAFLARAGSPPDNPTAAWADSVSAGALAAFTASPILLTDSSSLDASVDAWLDVNGVTRTLILGGTAAIDGSVDAQVPGATRVAGGDRTATAAQLATGHWPQSGERRYVLINGEITDGWAFGLAAAGLGADFQAPTLLVGTAVSPSTAQLISTCGAPAVQTLVVGDTSVVGQDVLTSIGDLDRGAC